MLRIILDISMIYIFSCIYTYCWWTITEQYQTSSLIRATKHERWSSQKWSQSNRYHTAYGESWKYIWKRTISSNHPCNDFHSHKNNFMNNNKAKNQLRSKLRENMLEFWKAEIQKHMLFQSERICTALKILFTKMSDKSPKSKTLNSLKEVLKYFTIRRQIVTICFNIIPHVSQPHWRLKEFFLV